MKCVLLLGLIGMSLIAPSVSQGGDDYVIAQELAIDDVRKTITSQITSA